MVVKVVGFLVLFSLVITLVKCSPASSCENDTFSVTCSNSKPRIKSATYGRNSPDFCPHSNKNYMKNTKCGMENNGLQEVRVACEGGSGCSFTVTNGFFGFDPCPLTYKYVTVDFDCVPWGTRDRDHPEPMLNANSTATLLVN